MNKCMFLSARKLGKAGFYVSYFGLILILLWVGIFKFTITEAEAIRPLVENHLLMWWMYDMFSLQTVSEIIGSLEIATALLLLFGLYFKKARIIGGFLVIMTFILTISFIFTTPETFKVVDGIPITDFFILKDLVMLGFGGIIMTSFNI